MGSRTIEIDEQVVNLIKPFSGKIEDQEKVFLLIAELIHPQVFF